MNDAIHKKLYEPMPDDPERVKRLFEHHRNGHYEHSAIASWYLQAARGNLYEKHKPTPHHQLSGVDTEVCLDDDGHPYSEVYATIWYEIETLTFREIREQGLTRLVGVSFCPKCKAINTVKKTGSKGHYTFAGNSGASWIQMCKCEACEFEFQYRDLWSD